MTEEAITEASIKFPPEEGGVHVYHVDDQVVFTDKLARVNKGPITEFEQYDRKVYVTVSTEHGLMMVELRRVLFEGHPRAAAMLERGTPDHLACGTLVRVRVKGKPLGGICNGDLAVVLADKGQRVNVARLGGAGDAYARVSHDSLTVVKVDPRTGELAG
jgi:hypothetical protein